jgi:hypothetical protein
MPIIHIYIFIYTKIHQNSRNLQADWNSEPQQKKKFFCKPILINRNSVFYATLNTLKITRLSTIKYT